MPLLIAVKKNWCARIYPVDSRLYCFYFAKMLCVHVLLHFSPIQLIICMWLFCRCRWAEHASQHLLCAFLVIFIDLFLVILKCLFRGSNIIYEQRLPFWTVVKSLIDVSTEIASFHVAFESERRNKPKKKIDSKSFDSNEKYASNLCTRTMHTYHIQQLKVTADLFCLLSHFIYVSSRKKLKWNRKKDRETKRGRYLWESLSQLCSDICAFLCGLHNYRFVEQRKLNSYWRRKKKKKFHK